MKRFVQGHTVNGNFHFGCLLPVSVLLTTRIAVSSKVPSYSEIPDGMESGSNTSIPDASLINSQKGIDSL